MPRLSTTMKKLNIVERIVLGAQALGVEKVFVMPDSYNMGYRVEDKLNSCNELRCEINVVNMMRFDGDGGHRQGCRLYGKEQ